MADPQLHRLTRRQLLIGGGAAAGAVLLGACGDDGPSGSDQGSASDGGGTAGAGEGLVLAQFFGGAMFVAGVEARMPFGVADQDGLLPIDRTPESLVVSVLSPEGDVLEDGLEVTRHAEGLPRAYFPLRVTLDEPGIYTARTELGGTATEMSFQLHATEDVEVVQPGAPLPAVDTPTEADARGVTPLCTNDPVCPLHDRSLSEVLGAGSPVALLVATPAFCQLAICGPVLDVLLDVAPDHPNVTFLHAEVYANPAESLQAHAPIVEQLGLHFEPCLLLAGSDGVLVDRVDTIYDRVELSDKLARLEVS